MGLSPRGGAAGEEGGCLLIGIVEKEKKEEEGEADQGVKLVGK